MRESKFVEFDFALHPSIRTFLEGCPANMSPLQHVGYTFEVVVALALAKAGIQRILTNPLHDIEQWTRQQGLGVDIVLPDESIIIEVKNNDDSYWLTPAMIHTDTLSRFIRTDPKHLKKWMVVFAHNKLSIDARRLLAEHNVVVVVARRTATRRSMPSLVKTLARSLREVLYSGTLFTESTMPGALDGVVVVPSTSPLSLVARFLAHFGYYRTQVPPHTSASTLSETHLSIRPDDVIEDLVQEAHFAAVDKYLYIYPR